jgi:HAE1 family hydrophobic/amphiphilic exporter-1
VFVPTAAIPGITGRLYQQFAVTVAVSVMLSAFNALTLSPALCSLLLKPKTESHGPLGRFFKGFNYWFGRATDGYVSGSHYLIRKAGRAMLLLGLLATALSLHFCRPARRKTGLLLPNVQLPPASSLPQGATARQIEEILARTGIQLQHHRRLQPAQFSIGDLQRFYFVTLNRGTSA